MSDSGGGVITEDDEERIDEILSFWFKEQELSAPQIDRRMDIWFGEDPAFDHEIRQKFSADVDKASEGKLDHWADEPRGRLALILLHAGVMCAAPASRGMFANRSAWRARLGA